MEVEPVPQVDPPYQFSKTHYFYLDNRIGSAEIIIPPRTTGPPAHWHEMHDETFLVQKGTVRFHAPDGQHIDAKEGDYVVVPTRAPHTFSNPFDEEARFFNTYTPAFYINYFKLLKEMQESGQAYTKEMNLEAMSRFATLPAKEMLVEKKDWTSGGGRNA
ncbi:hypothetical protein M501DRAFT_997937 [Patellaria atrata CBS 101060]|uniref:Cupin type-2 domain-containing protein n=1 Tax=Patellaria atrata CBS 101060 TaxID=1346257 RepID=A0A9P4SF82_9PEZI|nr:hypothetical protein M501DRAFT_997937 [Patellaria atrata CBS 101060]